MPLDKLKYEIKLVNNNLLTDIFLSVSKTDNSGERIRVVLDERIDRRTELNNGQLIRLYKDIEKLKDEDNLTIINDYLKIELENFQDKFLGPLYDTFVMFKNTEMASLVVDEKRKRVERSTRQDDLFEKILYPES
ncbi:MAG: hypothetical protein Q9M91_05825 [Candidatus Dojkabacteria bacterium]|nr:hypothetical protein [Candidatus Dojkabacteria bacterium]MDQ7021318.1 hypothetical protein [Candidatus Dojkabacteria bacterium]